MLLSYEWLKQYMDLTDVSVEQLAKKLTKAGIEVEEIRDLGSGISGTVVGDVKTCEPHPNADKLKVCQVDIGEGNPVQIVCGASNVKAGQKVAVAKHDATLPGNVKIKRSKLRGEMSSGMICSLKELGVEERLLPPESREGIYVFTSDVTVGRDVSPYLNLTDQVLDLDITPNRADCLNMFGIAYEVGAILDRPVHLPEVEVQETGKRTDSMVSVQIENEQDNPYYGVRMIENVKIGPSPEWMQQRLMASGIRPINNVVDITNYVLMEYGQPLHAFDYDRLESKKIVTRRARDGETIQTLDGEQRTLSGDNLVITNNQKPIAVAGVMGGASTEVHADTTTVLLEAAYFNPICVRRSAAGLGIHSESSQRFERGVDPNRVVSALSRAAQLMVEWAGGKVLTSISEAGKRTVKEKMIAVKAEKINRVLGTNISVETMLQLFNRLGFEGELQEGTFTLTIPTRRMDISIEEDLVEEIGRLYGYDHLQATLPFGHTTPARLSKNQTRRRKVRCYMEGAGLYEAITYSLTTKENARKYAESDKDDRSIQLSMPMSEDRSTLRKSLIPQLLEALQYNLNRRHSDLALYEMGTIFLTEEEVLTKLPEEKERLAAVFTGIWQSYPWQHEKTKIDFYVVKGVLEGLLTELGLASQVTYAPIRKEGLHPGRSAAVTLGHQRIGYIGQVHPSEAEVLDLNETYVFEVDLDAILSAQVGAPTYQPLPKFPSITRDIALIVDDEVAAANVQSAIRQAGGLLLKEIHLFDVYRGEPLDHGKKSLAFSLEYVHSDRTLTDDEVTAVHSQVLEKVKAVFGARLRS